MFINVQIKDIYSTLNTWISNSHNLFTFCRDLKSRRRFWVKCNSSPNSALTKPTILPSIRLKLPTRHSQDLRLALRYLTSFTQPDHHLHSVGVKRTCNTHVWFHTFGVSVAAALFYPSFHIMNVAAKFDVVCLFAPDGRYKSNQLIPSTDFCVTVKWVQLRTEWNKCENTQEGWKVHSQQKSSLSYYFSTLGCTSTTYLGRERRMNRAYLFTLLLTVFKIPDPKFQVSAKTHILNQLIFIHVGKSNRGQKSTHTT